MNLKLFISGNALLKFSLVPTQVEIKLNFKIWTGLLQTKDQSFKDFSLKKFLIALESLESGSLCFPGLKFAIQRLLAFYKKFYLKSFLKL